MGPVTRMLPATMIATSDARSDGRAPQDLQSEYKQGKPAGVIAGEPMRESRSRCPPKSTCRDLPRRLLTVALRWTSHTAPFFVADAEVTISSAILLMHFQASQMTRTTSVLAVSDNGKADGFENRFHDQFFDPALCSLSPSEKKLAETVLDSFPGYPKRRESSSNVSRHNGI